MEESVIFENGHYEVRSVPLRQLYEVVNVQTGILEESTNSHYAAIAYAIRAKAALEQLLSNPKAMEWPDVDEDPEPSKPH